MTFSLLHNHVDSVPFTHALDQVLPERYVMVPKGDTYIVHRSRLRCSGYAAEWIARVLGVSSRVTNEYRRGPIWFDVFRPGTRTSIISDFANHSLRVISVKIVGLSDIEKILWLKERLYVHQTPVMLLIRTKNKAPHWVAVAGYDDTRQEFFAYNPNSGKHSKENEVAVGNELFPYGYVAREWGSIPFLKYKAYVVCATGLR